MWSKVALTAALLLVPLSPLSAQGAQTPRCQYPLDVNRQYALEEVGKHPHEITWVEFSKSESKKLIDAMTAPPENVTDDDTMIVFADVRQALAVMEFSKNGCIVYSMRLELDKIVAVVQAVLGRQL